ncbi:hypothetical protein Tco_0461724 [Tanacetum coccineum]
MVRSMMSLTTCRFPFGIYALESSAAFSIWFQQEGRQGLYNLPSENTSEHPIEEEILAPIVSQEEDVVPVRKSVRTHKALDRLYLNVEIDPDRLSFNIKVEEHSLGDLNEPANYKAALSGPDSKSGFGYERGNAIHE